MVENITFENKLYAIILRTEFNSEGIEFFTPNNFSQQLGYMKRAKDYIIPPHVHNPVIREVSFTKEVLFIKSGSVRVDFFNENQAYIFSKVLRKGDVILLAFGGHGFKMLEESEIIEVKQGPYAGEADKTRFQSLDDGKVKFK